MPGHDEFWATEAVTTLLALRSCRTALDQRQPSVVDFPCPRSGKHDRATARKRSMTSPDMTIRDISMTMLRMPWADDPWLKGHALGSHRDILICEVETAGGITGMGYLFLFRPGMKSIAACLDECIIPRVKGKDATAVEAIWRDLWTATMTYGRGGIAAMAM